MKPLREGFTTGSCAAAAALACCILKRDGVCPETVSITVPEGRLYTAEVVPHEDGRCGVIKYSGDDPDVTNGMEVIADVRLRSDDGDISFIAGEGVGRITEDGLKIPKGGAAINPVPRRMIEDAVRSVFGPRAAEVTISIPGGEEVARKTFNPRLGIIGGLSVLGTSGIVRPMSEQALRDAMLVELKMRREQGYTELAFTFGNQGEEAMRKVCPGMCVVQVSNEPGFMLDCARELGIKRVILGGHPGKLSKVAAGCMQTHSKYTDSRREAIITHLALMGAPITLIKEVYACVTTDAAVKLIARAGCNEVWNQMATAARRYCMLRTRGEVDVGIMFVDGEAGILGKCVEDDD